MPGLPGAEFLISISHEKAHEDLHNYRASIPSELGGAEVVLNEFYPMLEEQLAFYNLSAEDKDKVRTPVRAIYDASSTESKGFTGFIPGSETPLHVKSHIVNIILNKAYGHSLYQEKPRAKIVEAVSLLERGLSPTEIDKILKNYKIKRTPVLRSEDLELHEEH